MTNPWLPAEPIAEAAVNAAPPVQGWHPQRLDVPVLGALPVHSFDSAHRLWVVGAHGGAGASSWAKILGCGDAGCAWPETGTPVRVLVAARTHRRGLEAARRAAIQWASGNLAHIELVGLLATPDAPGRMPKALRDVYESVTGAFPHVFSVPWVDAWRLTDGTDIPLDKKTASLSEVLSQMKGTS